MKPATYQLNNDDSIVYKKIRKKVNEYFLNSGFGYTGNGFLYLKASFLLIVAIFSYFVLITADGLIIGFISYFSFLFSNLVFAITIGHDAGHHAVTGKRKIDDFIYKCAFILNGISPIYWNKNHNTKHHVYPNVTEKDSDINSVKFVRISETQPKLRIYRWQHYYAPFFYLFSSLYWVFYLDFSISFKKNKSYKKLIGQCVVKLVYLFIVVLIPLYATGFSFTQLLSFFLLSHIFLSPFLCITFFVSHHVNETIHDTTIKNNIIQESWLRQQVLSTIDFHGTSKLVNIFFGGFHAHVAHHLFPKISHIHYPSLTKIIIRELKGSNMKYTSLDFHKAIKSHFSFLKKMGQT